MWCTHKKHMHHPIKRHGQKVPYLWLQFNLTKACIHLIPTKRKPKIDLYLLNLPPLPPPISFILSSKTPCKISLIRFWLNPPNLCLSINSSILFETISFFKAFFSSHIPSITDEMIIQGEIPVKEGFLAVTPVIYFTANSEIILLGRFTKQTEERNFTWVKFSLKLS